MENRKEDKIDEIKSYLVELDSFLPTSYSDYVVDFELKAACERYFEKIVEAVVDLAFVVIKEKKFQTPNSDKNAFEILAEEKLISTKLSERLQNAKGMRNVIAHEYGEIDDDKVFYSITEELIFDVEKFLEEINEKGRV